MKRSSSMLGVHRTNLRRPRVRGLRVRPVDRVAAKALGLATAVVLGFASLAGVSFGSPVANYHVYFANLHSHTGYSDGRSVPSHAYAFARDTARIQVLAVTDHSSMLSRAEWDDIAAQAEAASIPGQFVGIRGFEWTNDLLGHMNVFFSDTFVTETSHPLMPALYAWLDSQPGAIAQFNHPNRIPGEYDHFRLYPEADSRVALFEVQTGYQLYHVALDSGWHVGVSCDQDNHAADWGMGPCLTGIWAESLVRSSIRSAIGRRRTFGTTDRNLVLQFTVNDSWMGSLVPNGRLKFAVVAADPDPDDIIESVSILTNGNQVLASRTVGDANNVSWEDSTQTRITDRRYFYVIVLMRDNTYAVSSAVWTTDTGWAALSEVPQGPEKKGVRDGGCLAYERATGSVYALRGNNTCEFYEYSPAAGTWAPAPDIPAGGRGKQQNGVGKGACMTVAGGALYAAKGNSSVEFWQYKAGTWTELADIPNGQNPVEAGAGAAGVTVGGKSYVYLLKGSGTQEFYRYDPLTDQWQTLASVPDGAKKSFKDGFAMAYDGANTIYAFKRGDGNEFFAYDIARDAWTTRAALPLVGRSGKKNDAGEGAALAFNLGLGYALKGGNTREFWVYRPELDQWQQSTDMPAGNGKDVEAGGALTSAGDRLYALKGNKTLEFYQYVPVGSWYDGGSSGGQANPIALPGFRLTVAPNPTSGIAHAYYALPRSGAATLKVFDIAGHLKRQDRSGKGCFELRGLAAGVYVIEVTSDNMCGTRRLVVLK